MGAGGHSAAINGAASPSAFPALWLAAFPATLFAALVFSLITQPLPWSMQWAWVPSLGIDFAIYVDGLAAQFLLLITGIGTLVCVYAAGYLAGDARRWRVFILLGIFMLAMIGAVVSDHLITLFLFWELTSVLSFLLVGFDHAGEANRKSAKQAMMVTGFGGLALLAGIIVLAQLAGSWSIQGLIAAAPTLADDLSLRIALCLIFVGAFTKSAQFPFHFWLPNAMAAPTPVSAYLHSATLVKLGIYLLARLDAGFSDLRFWEYVLIGIGTLTALLAATQTIRERDLKRILAWSTVASLGTLTLLIGLPGEGAAMAVAALFLAHALYKAPLFFVAGNLDHGAGTRNIDQLTGMRRYMPWTAGIAMLAALSMAGVPLSLGFIAKNAIGAAKADANIFVAVSYASVLVNGIAVAVAAIAAIHIFWGRDTVPRETHPHEAPLAMLLPPAVLVITGLLFGLQPALINPLLGAAAHNIAPQIDAAALGSAYDLVAMIETSVGALVFGLLIYFGWERLHAWQRPLQRFDGLGPESNYWRLIKLLPRFAVFVTRRLQHGSLPTYLLLAVATAASTLLALLALPAGMVDSVWAELRRLPAPPLPVIGAALLIVSGAVDALVVRAPLVLLLVSGLVGYGSAVLFLFTGAPDLAFTQFSVETIFVVVAAAVLRQRRDHDAVVEGFRPLAMIAALALGAAMTALVLLVGTLPPVTALADFFSAQSLPAAHGRNVVNVIIVDFRALDTLGEIAVLAFALFAALPLLKLRQSQPRPR